MSNGKWTKEEEELCKKLLLEGKSYKEIAIILNRNIPSLRTKNSKKFHIDVGYFWTEEEINILKNIFGEYFNKDIQKYFLPNKSIISINNMGCKLGLKKSSDKMKEHYNNLNKLYNMSIWTEKELVLLIENYHKYSNEYISENIIKTRNSNAINAKAQHLGLKKDQEVINQTISDKTKGKIVNKDSIEKANKTKKERYKKEKHPLYSKHHTEETKKKISESHIGISAGENNPMYGKRGELSPNWKGDKSNTRLNLSIRGSAQFKEWRLEVYKRDKFICQHCGYNKGNILNVHHLTSLNILIKENKNLFDINNGITLCENCHTQNDNSFHKIYGSGWNTPEQFEEWTNYKKQKII